MNYKKLETLLLTFEGSTLSFPFDDKTPVFKVARKMFALVSIDQTPLAINLKCDPEDALILRSQFAAIKPGYHMNKEHWNTVTLDGSLEQALVEKLIHDSYELVVKTLSKKEQRRLNVSIKLA
ncbi:MAG: MmcQ/YjbR family DNA-binding protein [Candidatus Marinimicrobia bacterium]|nr:MmcQ/YjbR family DNA-binding protein [Candidatus Neomarinimicrobiota bacterium]